MRDPGLALATQEAIKKALLNDAGLMALIGGRVYDNVPTKRTAVDEVKFPYVVIGEEEITDDSNTCSESSQVSSAIHVWSDKPGKTQAKTVGGFVIRALDKELPIAGHRTPAGGFDIANAPRTDDNGHTEYVLFFSYLVDPIE